MEQNENNHKDHNWWCCGCHTKRGGLGWGIFFLVLGGYFLAQELGYISTDVSVWPVFLVALGVYLLARSTMRK